MNYEYTDITYTNLSRVQKDIEHQEILGYEVIKTKDTYVRGEKSLVVSYQRDRDQPHYAELVAAEKQIKELYGKAVTLYEKVRDITDKNYDNAGKLAIKRVVSFLLALGTILLGVLALFGIHSFTDALIAIVVLGLGVLWLVYLIKRGKRMSGEPLSDKADEYIKQAEAIYASVAKLKTGGTDKAA